MIENTKPASVSISTAFLCLFGLLISSVFASIVSARYRSMQSSNLIFDPDMPTTKVEAELFFYMQPSAAQVNRRGYQDTY